MPIIPIGPRMPMPMPMPMGPNWACAVPARNVKNSAEVATAGMTKRVAIMTALPFLQRAALLIFGMRIEIAFRCDVIANTQSVIIALWVTR